MSDSRDLAAANNADWCEVMARVHGLATHRTAGALTVATRPPPLYPDAVTLVAHPSIPDMLGRIDTSAGCSIKDSYATLDLSSHGFRVLFDAQWIVTSVRSVPAAATTAGLDWAQVRTADALAAWERAWRGPDGPAGVFLPALLDVPSVAVLAVRDGERVVAGAVANRSAGVVGLSNVFTTGARDVEPAVWPGLVACAASTFPGTAIVVGYESGANLAAACQNGFEAAGPLRVWVRP